jgi:hypothetical protein
MFGDHRLIIGFASADACGDRLIKGEIGVREVHRSLIRRGGRSGGERRSESGKGKDKREQKSRRPRWQIRETAAPPSHC